MSTIRPLTIITQFQTRKVPVHTQRHLIDNPTLHFMAREITYRLKCYLHYR